MKYSRLFIIFTTLIVTGLVGGFAWLRMADFADNQLHLAQRAVDVTAAEITHLLSERRSQVALFVKDQRDFISLLSKDPGNEQIRRILADRIAIYFPEHLSFAISNPRGELLYSGVQMLPGPMCLEDIGLIMQGKEQQVRVHPNPAYYHYDIMVPLSKELGGGVFFISFSFDKLTKLLLLARPENQSLVLVDSDAPTRIQLTDQGVPATAEKKQVTLTPSERERVAYEAPVEGTRWQLLAIFDPNLLGRHHQRVLYQAGLLLLIFIAYSVVTFVLVVNHERRRTRAEEALRSWKNMLEESNRELKTLATTDELTSIPNRRYFHDLAAVEMRRARRTWSPTSLLMIDVDHFKNYNDTYGHQAGDECLVKVAACISEVLKRPTDIVARYGGEEFVALLPDTPLVGAEQIAEAIRQAIFELGIEHASSDVGPKVTVSIGGCCMTPDDVMELEDLINRADEALYRAKSAGRNQVSTC